MRISSPITRFAPSPTGLLHEGHAFAAHFAAKAALDGGGKFLLRIEDIDTGRCRPEFEAAIYEDLAWLGLTWETPVRRQTEHMDDYRSALANLDAQGLLYPCFCTRKAITAEINAAQSAPHLNTGHVGSAVGPDGPHYPRTCRKLTSAEVTARTHEGEPFALRLDMSRAVELATRQHGPLHWHDQKQGDILAQPEIFGDVILARKDIPTSYHLAVTVDDHIQGVNLVTRGTDLFEATHIHRLLQALLNFDVPTYHHHPLLRNPEGQRLAKRKNSPTLRSMRESGANAHDITLRFSKSL